MRTLAMFSTALALVAGTALMAEAPNSAAPQTPGNWGARSRVGKLYNPNTIQDAAGTVVSFQQTRPRLSRWHAVVVFLKTPNNDSMEVHLGPQWFLEENSLNLQPNDPIAVSGSLVTVEGRPFLMANKITKGDKTLVLRKDDGRPAWINKAPSARFQRNQTQKMN